MLKTAINNGKIICEVDLKIFSQDAIFKALYWYSNSFLVTSKESDKLLVIEFLPKKNVDQESLEYYECKIQQDFIDFNLRDIVSKETKTIRELIIAKAFDPIDEINEN